MKDDGSISFTQTMTLGAYAELTAPATGQITIGGMTFEILESHWEHHPGWRGWRSRLLRRRPMVFVVDRSRTISVSAKPAETS